MNIKTPPHCQYSEDALIGSVLLDPSRLDNLTAKPDDFFDNRNALLWKIILEIRAEGTPFDGIILSEYLKSTSMLERIGGYDRLAELQDVAVVPTHSQHYEEAVIDAAKLRGEISILQKGLEVSYSGKPSTDEVISSLMSGPMEENMTSEDIIERWQEAALGNFPSIPTPFPDLDQVTGGIRRGVPTIFTGRTKSGKSMFLATWYNYLGQRDIPILVIPLEDDYHITITRMAANLGKYKWQKLENGGEMVFGANGKHEFIYSTPEEIAYGAECLKTVIKYPVHFHNEAMSHRELMGVASKFKRKHNVKGFFLDGVKDFLKPTGKYADLGYDEEISQTIKHVCKQTDLAGVIVHHLTKIDDKELIAMGNIRGSGNIVSDARAVYAWQDLGLAENNVLVSKDFYGRQTTRAFECLGGNHGGTGRKILDTDLSRVQVFAERHDLNK